LTLIPSTPGSILSYFIENIKKFYLHPDRCGASTEFS